MSIGLKWCYKCKSEKSYSEFGKNKGSKDGFCYECKPCKREKERLFRLRNPEKTKLHNKIQKQKRKLKINFYNNYVPRGKYNCLRSQARQRGIFMDLSFEQFLGFWEKPCFYCGSEIKNVALDRIDPNFGYSILNVKPCCWVCNHMKKRMGFSEFIGHCRKISERFNEYSIAV